MSQIDKHQLGTHRAYSFSYQYSSTAVHRVLTIFDYLCCVLYPCWVQTTIIKKLQYSSTKFSTTAVRAGGRRIAVRVLNLAIHTAVGPESLTIVNTQYLGTHVDINTTPGHASGVEARLFRDVPLYSKGRSTTTTAVV